MQMIKNVDFKWEFGTGTSQAASQEPHLPDPMKGPYHFQKCTFHKRIHTLNRDYKGSLIQTIKPELKTRNPMNIWEFTFRIH